MQRSFHTTTPTLAREFYERNSVRVAKELLGKVLVRRLGATVLEGIIVEVEAYRGCDDPASHAYRGPTRRNQVMFGQPGHAYVYLTYGMHYCFNVTTEPIGQPGAVLIRAAQPLRGIEQMKKQRGTEQVKKLANGPAKLTQAFAVTKALNGHDLTLGAKLFITESDTHEPLETVSRSRIGIRAGIEKPWRFLIKDNPFVSEQ
ncbi:DNA-3-methyladenine glycosylase [[Eubacterium] cellulosolvens]